MTGIVLIVTHTMTISTHTLTWSVTKSNINNKQLHKISTHTLTWSVTKLCKLTSNH